MKKFLKRILLLLIIPYCILCFLDIALSKYVSNLQRFPAENEVWNDIYISSINSECVILGSSRAWVHFSPKIIYENSGITTYNLGEDGSDILRQYIRFKEYIKYNESPNKVILNVDLFSLKPNVIPHYSFYPYIFCNKDVLGYLKEWNYLNFNKAKFLIPMIRYLEYTRKYIAS